MTLTGPATCDGIIVQSIFKHHWTRWNLWAYADYFDQGWYFEQIGTFKANRPEITVRKWANGQYVSLKPTRYIDTWKLPQPRQPRCHVRQGETDSCPPEGPPSDGFSIGHYHQGSEIRAFCNSDLGGENPETRWPHPGQENHPKPAGEFPAIMAVPGFWGQANQFDSWSGMYLTRDWACFSSDPARNHSVTTFGP